MSQKTLDNLKSENWVFENHGTCRDCADPIEWWRSPYGKMVPFDPMPRGTSEAIHHSKTCSERN